MSKEEKEVAVKGLQQAMKMVMYVGMVSFVGTLWWNNDNKERDENGRRLKDWQDAQKTAGKEYTSVSKSALQDAVASGTSKVRSVIESNRIQCEAEKETKGMLGQVKIVEVGQKGKPAQKVPLSPTYLNMVMFIKDLQWSITSALEELEASTGSKAKFAHDSWLRANNGGEGISCVISDGNVFEKGGVNISIVHGTLPPAAVKQMKSDHSSLQAAHLEGKALPYAVCGLSLVLHPKNPNAPTAHLNYRYFETYSPDNDWVKNPNPEPIACWFGGGADLTPTMLYEEDVVHFHRSLKETCDKHDTRYYPDFKAWADKYFFIPHRGETRGVGGIFFDDLDPSSAIYTKPLPSSNTSTSFFDRITSLFSSPPPPPAAPRTTPPTQDEIFTFVKDIGNAFNSAYIPILRQRWNQPYTDTQKRFQQVRRGRYVEFNLVNDRGTKFGLNTPGARIESMLMTLPTTARWEYMCPLGEEGSGDEFEKIMGVFKKPQEWV